MEKLRLSDEVLVIAGKDKGKKGKIVKVFSKQNRVIVEGVNLVKKALKPTQENPAGGFAEKEISIHRSNVQVVSPKSGKATRVTIQVKDGKNIRVAKNCGSVLS